MPRRPDERRLRAGGGLATSWQVQYKTEDTQSRASADVATIMVPDAPWTGPGPRPLVSYQTAEDGVGSKCSPSYALDGGVVGADGNSEAGTSLIFAALRKGWAVIAPDYEGPGSDFLGAAGEAHGVLDGVRAALRFAPMGSPPARRSRCGGIGAARWRTSWPRWRSQPTRRSSISRASPWAAS